MASEYILTQEQDLTDAYTATIEPFWDEKVVKDQFKGVDDLKIHVAYLIHPASKGAIVLSSGRTEGSIKYKEVFYDLYQNGYSVFTLDHRGQGQSGRMASNPDKGYVKDYGDFVNDLNTFVTQFVLPNSQHQPVFLCHSMGCPIGALYAIKHPNVFAKIAFTAPFFGINSPIPEGVANFLIGTSLFFNNLFSDEPWYFLGQGDAGSEPFETNVVSQSETRYQIAQKVFEDADAKLGGITTQWLKATLIALSQVELQADQIKVPVLLIQAGSDVVVKNASQDVVCEKIPNCTMEVVEGAYHELMMEQDQYRVKTMTSVLNFFEN